jgi:uncharacterized protein YbcI
MGRSALRLSVTKNAIRTGPVGAGYDRVTRRSDHRVSGSFGEQVPSRAPGEVLTEISDGLVGLLKDYYGKGPTQAKTYYHDDLVVCLLRGGFTRVEKTLQEGGRGEAVIHQRMAFQEVMRQRFEAVVERATGRRVVGFMSGNQQHPDMICEVFILAPSDLVDERELPDSMPPHGP